MKTSGGCENCCSSFQPIDIRFIEYMPFAGNKWSHGKFVPYRQMLGAIMAEWPEVERLQDGHNDTSKVGFDRLLVEN